MILRRGILAVLSVLIVVSVAALGYQAVHRGGAPWATDNPTQDARDDVMAQARTFMTTVNTYGPDLVEGQTMPSYRSGVEDLVTAKFKAEFEQNVPYAEATVVQSGLARTTKVYATGASDLDTDRGRATVLVAGEFTNSFADPKAPQDTTKRQTADPQPYRVQVALVRQGGQWKVDNFTPVGTTDQGSGSSSAPTTAPTTGATP